MWTYVYVVMLFYSFPGRDMCLLNPLTTFLTAFFPIWDFLFSFSFAKIVYSIKGKIWFCFSNWKQLVKFKRQLVKVKSSFQKKTTWFHNFVKWFINVRRKPRYVFCKNIINLCLLHSLTNEQLILFSTYCFQELKIQDQLTGNLWLIIYDPVYFYICLSSLKEAEN